MYGWYSVAFLGLWRNLKYFTAINRTNREIIVQLSLQLIYTTAVRINAHAANGCRDRSFTNWLYKVSYPQKSGPVYPHFVDMHSYNKILGGPLSRKARLTFLKIMAVKQFVSLKVVWRFCIQKAPSQRGENHSFRKDQSCPSTSATDTLPT